MTPSVYREVLRGLCKYVVKVILPRPSNCTGLFAIRTLFVISICVQNMNRRHRTYLIIPARTVKNESMQGFINEF